MVLPKKTIKLAIILFAFVVLLLIAIAIKTAEKLPPIPVPYVSTAIVRQQSWQPHIRATGTLSPYQGITIKAEINARVTGIYFTSGQTVEKGEKLLQFDDNTQKAKLNYAKAQLELKKLTYERNDKLSQTQAVSREDFDTAKSEYEEGAAQVQEYQADLDKTTVYTPFNGKLGITNIALGDYITAGQDIVTLQQLDPMYADFSIPEKYSGSIKIGDRVDISINAYPKKIFTGQVYAFEPKINADTGTIMIRATLSNKDQLLLPGNFIEATLYFGKTENRIIVPQTAIVYSEEGNYVYRLENGKAVKIPIKIIGQAGQNDLISEGLAVGETIIVDGTDKIHDGSKVNVNNSNATGYD